MVGAKKSSCGEFSQETVAARTVRGDEEISAQCACSWWWWTGKRSWWWWWWWSRGKLGLQIVDWKIYWSPGEVLMDYSDASDLLKAGTTRSFHFDRIHCTIQQHQWEMIWKRGLWWIILMPLIWWRLGQHIVIAFTLFDHTTAPVLAFTLIIQQHYQWEMIWALMDYSNASGCFAETPSSLWPPDTTSLPSLISKHSFGFWSW